MAARANEFDTGIHPTEAAPRSAAMYVKEPADYQCHVLVKFCGGKILTSDKVQGDLRACDEQHGQLASLLPYTINVSYRRRRHRGK